MAGEWGIIPGAARRQSQVSLRSGATETPGLTMCSAIQHVFALPVRKAAAPSDLPERAISPALYRNTGI